jgi:hypothetical protein
MRYMAANSQLVAPTELRRSRNGQFYVWVAAANHAAPALQGTSSNMRSNGWPFHH